MMDLVRTQQEPDAAGADPGSGTPTIVACLESALPDLPPMSLRFFGDWFGRPFDNGHVLRRVSAQGDRLILEFHEGEVLEIVSPRGCVWNRLRRVGEPLVTIEDAARLTWRWNYYGEPATERNRHYIEYERVGPAIARRTDSNVPAHEGFPDRSSPAVAMH